MEWKLYNNSNLKSLEAFPVQLPPHQIIVLLPVMLTSIQELHLQMLLKKLFKITKLRRMMRFFVSDRQFRQLWFDDEHLEQIL